MIIAGYQDFITQCAFKLSQYDIVCVWVYSRDLSTIKSAVGHKKDMCVGVG